MHILLLGGRTIAACVAGGFSAPVPCAVLQQERKKESSNQKSVGLIMILVMIIRMIIIKDF